MGPLGPVYPSNDASLNDLAAWSQRRSFLRKLGRCGGPAALPEANRCGLRDRIKKEEILVLVADVMAWAENLDLEASFPERRIGPAPAIRSSLDLVADRPAGGGCRRPCVGEGLRILPPRIFAQSFSRRGAAVVTDRKRAGSFEEPLDGGARVVGRGDP